MQENNKKLIDLLKKATPSNYCPNKLSHKALEQFLLSNRYLDIITLSNITPYLTFYIKDYQQDSVGIHTFVTDGDDEESKGLINGRIKLKRCEDYYGFYRLP